MMSFSCYSQKKKTKKIVSNPLVLIEGTITETHSYCGGARPPEDLIKELRTPKPITAQYKLYIRKDSNDLQKPILYTVLTDTLGKFSIKLPIGKYVFVDANKKDKDTYSKTLAKYKTENSQTSAIDIECYKQYIATPDFTVEVTKNSSKLAITHNYHRDCNWSGAPCVEYRGPLPQ